MTASEQVLRDAISVALLPASPVRLREAHAARRAWIRCRLMIERQAYATALKRQLAAFGVVVRVQAVESAPVRDTEGLTLQWRSCALDRGHELVEQGVRVRRAAEAVRLFQVRALSGAVHYDVALIDVEPLVWSILHPDLPGLDVAAKAACPGCDGFRCSTCGGTGVVYDGRAA